VVDAIYDSVAGVWVATSDDVPGLVTEAETVDLLADKLRVVVPELLEANQGVLTCLGAMTENLLERIEMNPEVMLGKPVIRGTRITVEILLEKIAAGISFEEILADYPRLLREDILAAVAYAAEPLEGIGSSLRAFNLGSDCLKG